MEVNRGRLVETLAGFGLAGLMGVFTSLTTANPWPATAIGLAMVTGILKNCVFTGTTSGASFLRTVLSVVIPFLCMIPVFATSSEHEDVTHGLLVLAIAAEIILIAGFSHKRAGLLMLSFVCAAHLVLLAVSEQVTWYLLPVGVFLVLKILFWLRIQVNTFPDSLEHSEDILHAMKTLPKNRLNRSQARLLSGLRVLLPLLTVTIFLAVLFFILTPRGKLPFTLDPIEQQEKTPQQKLVRSKSDTAPVVGTVSKIPASIPGFSDTALLPLGGRTPEDSSVVMKIKCTDGRGNPMTPFRRLLLRGMVLDTYKGSYWFSRAVLKKVQDKDDGNDDRWTRLKVKPPPDNFSVWQKITLHSMESTCVYTMPEATAVSFDTVKYEHRGTLLLPQAPGSSIVYHVESAVIDMDNAPLENATRLVPNRKYLALPKTYRRIQQLAYKASGGKGPLYYRCKRIERFLKKNYAYTKFFALSENIDPVEDFLFHRKKGYCVQFASAMVVMLRTLGIPSRLVCGFAARLDSPAKGMYTARTDDAHAWVEVYTAEFGWISFDPTAADSQDMLANRDNQGPLSGWSGFMSSFDESQRRKILRQTADFLQATGWIIIVILSGWILLKKHRHHLKTSPTRVHWSAPDNSPPVGFYEEFLRLMKKAGLKRKPSQTPLELAHDAASFFPKDQVDFVTRRFTEIRYGGRELTEADKKILRNVLRNLKAAAANLKKNPA